MNRSPALIHLACEFALLLLLWLVLPTAALTPSEVALRDVLGEGTPVPVEKDPHWPCATMGGGDGGGGGNTMPGEATEPPCTPTVAPQAMLP